jgi:hypothetical protein
LPAFVSTPDTPTREVHDLRTSNAATSKARETVVTAETVRRHSLLVVAPDNCSADAELWLRPITGATAAVRTI